MIEFIVGFVCSLIAFTVGAAVGMTAKTVVKDEKPKRNAKS